MNFGLTVIRETFNFWTPTYLVEAAGMTEGHAGMASSLFPFFGGISVFVAGYLSDTFAKRAWKQLRTGYGLQDGHPGSVVFVVRGDGRELFRSDTVADHELRRIELDVSGVKLLELSVEDAGNGATSDWGVWIAPELAR